MLPQLKVDQAAQVEEHKVAPRAVQAVLRVLMEYLLLAPVSQLAQDTALDHGKQFVVCFKVVLSTTTEPVRQLLLEPVALVALQVQVPLVVVEEGLNLMASELLHQFKCLDQEVILVDLTASWAAAVLDSVVVEALEVLMVEHIKPDLLAHLELQLFGHLKN
jgi:hypothetical protein